MISVNNKNPLANFFPSDSLIAKEKKHFVKFCFFLILIAVLELLQDYISTNLNNSLFVFQESLAYKLFWPLFIPLSIVFDYCISIAHMRFSRLQYVVWSIILSVLIAIIHLLIFSLVLWGISNIIHNEPMTLMLLIFEKMSTRLYIALSIYFILAGVFYFIRLKRSQRKTDTSIPSTALTIKNGRNSVLIQTADIKWIESDGAYLEIYTDDKKHVIVGRLKNIINELPSNFKRIHKSTILNMDRITELKSRGNGDYDVIADDSHILRLSRNYTNQLKINS